jgi:hypothetical protein
LGITKIAVTEGGDWSSEAIFKSYKASGLKKLQDIYEMGSASLENAGRMQAEQLANMMAQAQQNANALANNDLFGFKGGKSGGGRGTSQTTKELTEMQSNQQRINELTQEYVNISDNATADVVERQKEIRNEIALLNQRNNQLKLYSEQAQGKLQGGYVMQSNLGGDKQWNPSMADKSYLNIGAGLDSETLAKMNSVGDAGMMLQSHGHQQQTP